MQEKMLYIVLIDNKKHHLVADSLEHALKLGREMTANINPGNLVSVIFWGQVYTEDK